MTTTAQTADRARAHLLDLLVSDRFEPSTPPGILTVPADLAFYLFARPGVHAPGRRLAPWTACATSIKADSSDLTGARASTVHRDWYDAPAVSVPYTSEGDTAHGYPDLIGQSNRSVVIGENAWDELPGLADCDGVGLVIAETVLTGEAEARLEALATALVDLGYDDTEAEDAILRALDVDHCDVGDLDDLYRVWGEVQETADALSGYPPLNEEDHSEREHAAQEEEWDNGARSDFGTEVEQRTGLDLPLLALDDLREEACHATGRYPESEGHGYSHWPIEAWADWVAGTREGRAVLAATLRDPEHAAATASVNLLDACTLAHEEEEGGPITCEAVRAAIEGDAPTCPKLQALTFPGFEGEPSNAAALWDDGERISILLGDGTLILAQTRPEHPDQATLPGTV